MLRKTILAVLMMACLSLAGSALADNVTFDYEPLSTMYGSPVGDVPGDYMFSEYGADLYITDFFSAGTPYFNFARIDAAFTGPSIFFGNLQIININNVDVIFDFSSPGDVEFDYLNLGGSVNLQVNGYGAVMEGPSLAALAGVVAPGVTMTVTSSPMGGGVTGHVTLTGPVGKLRVGGQEFYLDDVLCHNGYAPGPGPCDFEVDHQSLAMGATWGSATNVPGDLIFIEDGIPVLLDVIHYSTGSGFNLCRVDPTPDASFGFDRVMNLNNIANRYDISALGITTSSVTFEYLDYGGDENIQVNGATWYVGDLATLPATVAPGVTMNVMTYAVPGGLRGEVTLTGDVQNLLVAGQEFYIDNICVSKDSSSTCVDVSDNETQPLGAAWGPAYGQSPGDIIFIENGIAVGVDVFDTGSGLQFNEASIGTAFCPIGSGNALFLNNICATYDFTPFSPVQEVSFEYCDGAGVENLFIDGLLYIGDIEALPAGYFPGVTASVTVNAGAGYYYGTVTLTGDIKTMWIGGQQFAIDDVCVIPGGASPVPIVPHKVARLDEAFPNPFNPRTTLSFRLAREGHVQLSIVDLRGRRVATLVDEARPAGEYKTVWNGTDDKGARVSSGMYFVMLKSGGEVQTRKISLLK